MVKFFKIKLSSILIILVMSLIPFLIIAIFSGEGMQLASDEEIGDRIKLQLSSDELISQIMSEKGLDFGAVRSVSLPGSDPGRAEYLSGNSGLLVVQYRGLKEPYLIKKITVIRSGTAEVIFD